MRDERGFSIAELLVSMGAALVVMTGVVTLTTTVIHSEARITNRVDAASRARPAMTRIVQELHSACVTSHIVPIRTGSTGTSISFFSKSGSGVGQAPDLHTISLTGSPPRLTDTVTPATPGSIAPNWDFSGQSSSRLLLTNVTAPGGVIFRYYDFVTGTGALNTAPLAVPLTDTTSARAAYVTVSFTSSPKPLDPGSSLLLTTGVDLRLENAGQYPNQDNLPCV
jgi:Tfp pilus assembly protein PilW